MSNVFKSLYFAGENKTARIIDYNEIISEKLEKIRSELESEETAVTEDGFSLGLNAERVETLLTEDIEENHEDVIAATDLIMENAKKEADIIVHRAEDEARKIIKKAEENGIQIMESAKTEGFHQGFSEGTVKCENELRIKQNELQERKKNLEEELLSLKKNMEPILVETILDVLNNITHVLTEDKKDLILSIVNSAFEGIEVSKNYIIKACREDVNFLKENKGKIVCDVTDANIEIVEDPSMKKGDCVIDTDIGIFDCSLDVQLERLTQDIKMLSCIGKGY